MDERRRWYRIHWSTVIVVVCIFGGFLWMNMRASRPHLWLSSFYFESWSYGWPFTWLERSCTLQEVSPNELVLKNDTLHTALVDKDHPYLPLVLNLLSCVGLLTIVAMTLECWRRRILRVHLSTAIILMFAACFFLHSNLTHRAIPGLLLEADWYEQGWPLTFKTVRPSMSAFEKDIERLRQDYSKPFTPARRGGGR